MRHVFASVIKSLGEKLVSWGNRMDQNGELSPHKYTENVLVTSLWASPDPEANQDACHYDLDTLTFAVSDGSTYSCRPHFFAKALVTSFASIPGFFDDGNATARADWWFGARTAWEHEVNLIRPSMRPPEVNLLRAQGAKATFRGIALKQEPFEVLQVAVGDCVEIWINEGQVVASDPQPPFNHLPQVLSTMPDTLDDSSLAISKRQALPGRSLILCTDALGEFLLTEGIRMGIERLFDQLRNMNVEEFEVWCKDMRERGLLKADDWTCIAVVFPKSFPLLEERQMPLPS